MFRRVPDVLVREAPPGAWTCGEIKVRHVFSGDGDCACGDASQVDGMLRACEAQVHSHYRPVQVRPWVLTSFGRPGEEMSADLRRLARLRAALGKAGQPSRGGSLERKRERRRQQGCNRATAGAYSVG